MVCRFLLSDDIAVASPSMGNQRRRPGDSRERPGPGQRELISGGYPVYGTETVRSGSLPSRIARLTALRFFRTTALTAMLPDLVRSPYRHMRHPQSFMWFATIHLPFLT